MAGIIQNFPISHSKDIYLKEGKNGYRQTGPYKVALLQCSTYRDAHLEGILNQPVPIPLFSQGIMSHNTFHKLTDNLNSGLNPELLFLEKLLEPHCSDG